MPASKISTFSNNSLTNEEFQWQTGTWNMRKLTNVKDADRQRANWFSTTTAGSNNANVEMLPKVNSWYVKASSNTNTNNIGASVTNPAGSQTTRCCTSELHLLDLLIIVSIFSTIFTNKSVICGIIFGALVGGIILGPVAVSYVQDQSKKGMI